MKKNRIPLLISGIIGSTLLFFLNKEKNKNFENISSKEDTVNINIKPREIYKSRKNIYLDKYIKLNILDLYIIHNLKTNENKLNINFEINNTSGENFYLDKSCFIKNNSSLNELYPINSSELILISNGSTLNDNLVFTYNSYTKKDNNLSILYIENYSNIIEINLLA